MDPSGHFAIIGDSLTDKEVSLRFHAMMTAEFGPFPTFIGRGTPTGGSVAAVVKVTGLAAVIYTALRTAGGCLMGTPIFAGASLLTATSPYVGFVCGPSGVTGPGARSGPGSRPRGSSSSSTTTAGRRLALRGRALPESELSYRTASTTTTTYSTATPAWRTNSFVPRERSPFQNAPYLAQMWFGVLMHDQVAASMAGLLGYGGFGNNSVYDYWDLADPQCWYGHHDERGARPRR